MQSYRIYTSSPRAAIIKNTIPSTTTPTARTMAYCTPFGYRVVRRSAAPAPQHAFFPSAALQADFSPLLRMFNDIDSSLAAASRQHAINNSNGNGNGNGGSRRPFQPRFDVREEQDAYHLHGELPGIEQRDLDIEFTTPNTLVVRGRTVRERSAGTPPTTRNAAAAGAIQAPEQAADATTTAAAAKAVEQDEVAEVEQAQSDAASDSGSNYHRPSVEDERDEDWTDAAPEADTPATTAATTTADNNTAEIVKKPEQQQQQVATQQTEQPQQQQQQQQQAETGRYWVSERSVGQFQRTFTFAGQINQDAVTANLKNGILSIVVPKVQHSLRKITVE